MSERAKRLCEVYEHLHNHYGIHNKSGFAENIEYANAYISSAMNGNEKYLTDNLFENICKKYPGVFNLDYLLNGEGELLTIEEVVRSQEIEKSNQPETIPEYVQQLCDNAARIIAQNEVLSKQLASSLAEVREMKSTLSNAIASTEGLKQQLSVLLHILQIPNNQYQGLNGLVSELAPGKKMPITDDMVRIIKHMFPVDESKI